MKKQIFTIILLLMGGVSTFGQSFKLDATGANDMRLRTSGADRLTILPTSGNVGIGTITPDAKLDLFGDLSFTKKRNLTTSGIQNALDRQGASRIFIDVSGTVTLNGIAGGVDGLMIFIYTGSGTTLVINNLDIAAISADRIATHTGGTVTITARGGTSLIYDGATGNWRIYGFADENSSWNSKGNAGTVPSTNFIGTSDNQSFVARTNNVERMRILNTGNVGIGTSTPDAKLDVAGSFALSGKTYLASLGTVNNLNLNGKSIIQIGGGENITLTGIAGGVEGMIVHIIVSSNSDLTLANYSSLSLFDNHIRTGSNADITISQGGGATLIYDSVNLDWVVIGIKQ